MTWPTRYACQKCSRASCRLWREYQSFQQTLLCQQCSEAEQEKWLLPSTGDQIGWRIPAVPNPLPRSDGSLARIVAFWGYTSVPDDGVAWWKRMPS